jgi:hypothetical protein
LAGDERGRQRQDLANGLWISNGFRRQWHARHFELDAAVRLEAMHRDGRRALPGLIEPGR